jgi:uncharacterized membrane protein
VALTGAAVLWAILLVASPLWAVANPDAPFGRGRRGLAAVVRLVGAQVCHQRPDRSFHLHGRALPVCGRCTALYLSGALGLLVVGHRRRRADGRARTWLATAAVPTLATWTLEVVGLWNPGTPLRALAAAPLGLAAGWLIGQALDE